MSTILSLKEYNEVFSKFGYQKLTNWEPTFSEPAPPRRDCAMFDHDKGKCGSLKLTYCMFEECDFYKDGKENQCQTK